MGLRKCFGPLTTIESVLRRGKRSGLCSGDVSTIAALVDRADDKLFESILHPTPCTEPDETVCSYELRRRRHNKELINKTSRLADTGSIIPVIYKDVIVCISFLYQSLCYFAFWQSLINEYDDDDDDDDDDERVDLSEHGPIPRYNAILLLTAHKHNNWQLTSQIRSRITYRIFNTNDNIIILELHFNWRKNLSRRHALMGLEVDDNFGSGLWFWATL